MLVVQPLHVTGRWLNGRNFCDCILYVVQHCVTSDLIQFLNIALFCVSFGLGIGLYKRLNTYIQGTAALKPLKETS